MQVCTVDKKKNFPFNSNKNYHRDMKLKRGLLSIQLDTLKFLRGPSTLGISF